MDVARLFVSYSRKDRSWLVEHLDALRAGAGAEHALVQFDEEILSPSQIWWTALVSAIRGCDVWVLLWSQHARRSPYVALELAEVFDRLDRDSVRILPVLLDDTPLPEVLKPFQALDLRHTRRKPIPWRLVSGGLLAASLVAMVVVDDPLGFRVATASTLLFAALYARAR